jgi:predicted transcriptional regulator
VVTAEVLEVDVAIQQGGRIMKRPIPFKIKRYPELELEAHWLMLQALETVSSQLDYLIRQEEKED